MLTKQVRMLFFCKKNFAVPDIFCIFAALIKSFNSMDTPRVISAEDMRGMFTEDTRMSGAGLTSRKVEEACTYVVDEYMKRLKEGDGWPEIDITDVINGREPGERKTWAETGIIKPERTVVATLDKRAFQIRDALINMGYFAKVTWKCCYSWPPASDYYIRMTAYKDVWDHYNKPAKKTLWEKFTDRYGTALDCLLIFLPLIAAVVSMFIFL